MQDIQEGEIEVNNSAKFRIIAIDEYGQIIVECSFLKKYIDLKRGHVVEKACERVYEEICSKYDI